MLLNTTVINNCECLQPLLIIVSVNKTVFFFNNGRVRNILFSKYFSLFYYFLKTLSSNASLIK